MNDESTSDKDDGLPVPSVVTFQPPALDHDRAAIVIEQHEEPAGEIWSMDSDRKRETLAMTYDVPEDDVVYIARQCTVVDGVLNPKDTIHVTESMATVDKRLTEQLQSETAVFDGIVDDE